MATTVAQMSKDELANSSQACDLAVSCRVMATDTT